MSLEKACKMQLEKKMCGRGFLQIEKDKVKFFERRGNLKEGKKPPCWDAGIRYTLCAEGMDRAKMPKWGAWGSLWNPKYLEVSEILVSSNKSVCLLMLLKQTLNLVLLNFITLKIV